MTGADRQKRKRERDKLGIKLFGPFKAEPIALALGLERIGAISTDCSDEEMHAALQRIIDRICNA